MNLMSTVVNLLIVFSLMFLIQVCLRKETLTLIASGVYTGTKKEIQQEWDEENSPSQGSMPPPYSMR